MGCIFLQCREAAPGINDTVKDKCGDFYGWNILRVYSLSFTVRHV